MEFEGRTVLVTGGSRGIGRAIVRGFAEEGARVAVHYQKNREEAEKTHGSLSGGPHALLQGDLADSESARSLVESTVRELGGLEVLVNNAGVFQHHRIVDLPFDEWKEAWRRTIDPGPIRCAGQPTRRSRACRGTTLPSTKSTSRRSPLRHPALPTRLRRRAT